MMTNVPAQWLPDEMVRHFYTLRWQIELLFKQLKTVLCIHKSNTGKENRLRCEIYGKLIMAVLIHRVHSEINIRLWNNNKRELSIEKLYKRIQERSFIILDLLLSSLHKAIKYLKNEISRLIKNCLKSKQRSRQTTLEILEFCPYKQIKSAISYAA
jgi:IS4 transposase